MHVIPLYTSNVDWLLVCHDERLTVFLTKSEAREGRLFRIDLQKQAALAFQKEKKQKGKDVSKVGIMKCSYVGVKNNEVLLILLLFFLFTFWSIHVLVFFFSAAALFQIFRFFFLFSLDA